MERGEREQNEFLQKRGLGAIDGAMSLMLVLLIVQIWLVSATLNAYLAGFDGVVLPGAIVSGLLFLACAGLYRFVGSIDRRSGGAPR